MDLGLIGMDICWLYKYTALRLLTKARCVQNLVGSNLRLHIAGISYDEMLKRLEPTPEQKELSRMQEQDRKNKEAIRLKAVCEAFWQNSDISEFDELHDALTGAGIVAEPTPDQIKALFDMLPASIIGQGIAWDFGDTEVRDSIYQYVRENREAVASRVAGIQK